MKKKWTKPELIEMTSDKIASCASGAVAGAICASGAGDVICSFGASALVV